LIATISVMVLLVMIALAMLSLSTVEMRSSQQGEAMKEAQALGGLSLLVDEMMPELGRSSGLD
jgi:hypothetical protein